MSSTMTAQRCVYALPILVVAGGAIAGMPAANADNKRLNESVVGQRLHHSAPGRL